MEGDNLDPEKSRQLEPDDVNIEFLQIIYEIIRSIEKDHHDSGKSKESHECSQKVLELKKRLDEARADVELLNGIGFSKEQQINNLEALKTQIRLKGELLQKYRCFVFDFQKP